MSAPDFYSEEIVPAEEPEILETSNPVCFDESLSSSELIHPCVSSGITPYTPNQEDLSELESRLRFRQLEQSDGCTPNTLIDSELLVDEFLNKLRERVILSKSESELQEWTSITETLKEKSRLLRNSYATRHNKVNHDELELNLNADSETVSKILLLLEKVEMLENLTGTECRPIESGSVQLQLNALTQKIEFLMACMSQQSKNLPTKLASADSLLSNEKESSLLQKIEYLYDRYASLRVPNLEKVNTKLKSIGLMATSIAPSSDFLNNIHSEFSAMRRQITDLENKLSDFEAHMADNRKMIWENQSQVDTWIKNLEKKLHN
ncbi:hypothetical protein KL905_004010 [Ogataea polymorpha]|uniref:Uncharacterized protein n=1 Tax=Ogataea polymorpha TaxID=460523 RepID=A0A9P8SXL9_9ASCO|nr:hypothetical protein KL937_003891 [Ogataea polymorpha]KAG7890592.1 hypothetical protein KL908_004429 [Ogataea polymorpha]KAG7898841.1 hypothetical protein KL935_003849 [Ogataea polymorpha]KAG7903852.1 hypothetical protein KL907_003879 [Ogataea polymorpha]KAG7907465.1 hypothetical protein KL906_004152 [Ogataea polymorpha]